MIRQGKVSGLWGLKFHVRVVALHWMGPFVVRSRLGSAAAVDDDSNAAENAQNNNRNPLPPFYFRRLCGAKVSR